MRYDIVFENVEKTEIQYLRSFRLLLFHTSSFSSAAAQVAFIRMSYRKYPNTMIK